VGDAAGWVFRATNPEDTSPVAIGVAIVLTGRDSRQRDGLGQREVPVGGHSLNIILSSKAGAEDGLDNCRPDCMPARSQNDPIARR
jgi:hypothetical protein